MALLHLSFCCFGLKRNVMLQSPNPRGRERECRPCVNLLREKLPQILWNCVKLKFASCTSNLMAQMLDFRKYTEFLLMLILSLPGLLQYQSLETIQVCNVVLCFPHYKINCIHMCDECKRSNAANVCHKLCPFRDRTSKFVHRPYNIRSHNTCQPNTDISEQFVSKL